MYTPKLPFLFYFTIAFYCILCPASNYPSLISPQDRYVAMVTHFLSFRHRNISSIVFTFFLNRNSLFCQNFANSSITPLFVYGSYIPLFFTLLCRYASRAPMFVPFYASFPILLYTSTPLHLYSSMALRLYAFTHLRLYASRLQLVIN